MSPSPGSQGRWPQLGALGPAQSPPGSPKDGRVLTPSPLSGLTPAVVAARRRQLGASSRLGAGR